MLRFDALTIFPELFTGFSAQGLVSKAVREQLIQVVPTNLRQFAVNTHGQVDDTPYGGGSGMVLRPEPAVDAISFAKQHNPIAPVILFTPRGRVFDQSLARQFARDATQYGGFILLCPRYEGVDERVAQHFVDHELSIGDYILMGGEVPAMAFIEAIVRLLPGTLGNPESIQDESFEGGLLEHPQYTKPNVFRGHQVPEVLISGNHGQIATWRREQAQADTQRRRPDLLGSTPGPVAADVSVVLLHHPVRNKSGETITSSITSLDLHDIARSSRTYGLTNFYVAHPNKMLRRLMQRICEHWETGYGATYNPNRGEALAILKIATDLDDVILDIKQRTGALPVIVATSARSEKSSVTFADLRHEMSTNQRPYLILLGTGWGLTEEVLDRANIHLEPVWGRGDYNHLSVRSAAAIIFDRLLQRN